VVDRQPGDPALDRGHDEEPHEPFGRGLDPPVPQRAEEPADDAWVRDWAAWASAYKICMRLRQEYDETILRLRAENRSVTDLMVKTARHEPIPIAA